MILHGLIQIDGLSLNEDCFWTLKEGWMSNTADTYSPTIPLIPGDHSDTEPANQQPENSAPAF